MSDDKKHKLPDLSDLDWDAALDEWDKNTFVPEVANEAESVKSVAPADPPTTKALYTPPPMKAVDPKADAGTVVARQPSERDSRSDAPRSARGGLGQLFAKPGPPPRPSAPQRAAKKSADEAPPQRDAELFEPLFDAPTSAGPRGGLGSVTKIASRDQIAQTRSTPDSVTVARAPNLEDATTESNSGSADAPASEATRVLSHGIVASSDDDEPTRMFSSEPPEAARGAPPLSMPPAEPQIRPSSAPRAVASAAEGRASWTDEKPASQWLDDAARKTFAERAEWLEIEARAANEALDQARGLLAVAELHALLGDRERACALATEARALAPRIALAWRTARQLATHSSSELAEMLDVEAQHAQTPAARAHATLLAADVRRVDGDVDGAYSAWEAAAKMDPGDVRAPLARAAVALASADHVNPALRNSEVTELDALDRAIAALLRLRGVERPGVEITAFAPNDALRRTREAIDNRDLVRASQAVAEIATLAPELAGPALWLSSALATPQIASRRGAVKALRALKDKGDAMARRALAARAIELADRESMEAALDGADGDVFSAADRAILAALAGSDATEGLEDLAVEKPGGVLAAALAHASSSPEKHAWTAGNERARMLVRLARLVADGSDHAEEAARASSREPDARAILLDAAIGGGRVEEVGDAITTLHAENDAAESTHHIAAGLIAELAGNKSRAAEAYRAANAAKRSEAIARAVAATDPTVDLGQELATLAEEMGEGPHAAMLWLEAIARDPSTDDASRAAALETVHKAAPSLGIAAFLAERIARRAGDVAEVVRWTQERRQASPDALETALDCVREAFLIADGDAEGAGARLEEAHRARPHDIALRELYERLAPETPKDGAAWREERATESKGIARGALFTEAAHAYESAGDPVAALRAAKLARHAGDDSLGLFALERAELHAGEVGRLIDGLLEIAKNETDPIAKREAYERLADVDAFGKKDSAASIAWHDEILDQDERFLPSLRAVEHELIGTTREDDLESIAAEIARALAGGAGGEAGAHAQLATRLRIRGGQGNWEATQDMADLAAHEDKPQLWSLRAWNAHARVAKNEQAMLETTLALVSRATLEKERATLFLRASECAARLDDPEKALAYLEDAAREDPGDVVIWGFLAEGREHAKDMRGAAEACESLARTSAVPDHQLLAWSDAARLWLDEVKDTDRGMPALEQVAAIDPTHEDVFARLSAIYAERKMDAELAELLERRLAKVTDPDERVTLEVERARALAEMGESEKAKTALESALEARPDHATALAAYGDLSAKLGDWGSAEQAWVRLARLLTTADEQRAIYDRLGELYLVHAPNLSRAEVAFKEVLKRSAGHIPTLEKLVDVYRKQNDVARAIETQQEIIAQASVPEERLARLLELAGIYEHTGRDLRKAEGAFEAARKEFPTSVVALRGLAEFYGRQRQMPAMHILLDRAAGDARRAFAAGRFVTALFEVLAAASELRGRKDAARVVGATLAAIEGQPSRLRGAEMRALDPRLDDLLAPEVLNPAFRILLSRAGDALDIASPVDVRALKATALPQSSPLFPMIAAVASASGLPAVQVMVTPQLGRVCIPLGSSPPTVLVGEGLVRASSDLARAFLIVRALKLVASRASALFRAQPADLSVLVSAWLVAFNPSWQPQGVAPKALADAGRRLQPGLPRGHDPQIGVIALEAAGTLAAQTASVGPAAIAWANRAALLAIGDPSAAIEAIAWSLGNDSAPTGSEERAAWVARTVEARELMVFSVSDAYAEARVRLGLDQ